MPNDVKLIRATGCKERDPLAREQSKCWGTCCCVSAESMHAQLVNMMSRIAALNRLCDHSLKNVSCLLLTDWAKMCGGVNLNRSGDLAWFLTFTSWHYIKWSYWDSNAALRVDHHHAPKLCTVWPKLNTEILAKNAVCIPQFFQVQAIKTGHISIIYIDKPVIYCRFSARALQPLSDRWKC